MSDVAYPQIATLTYLELLRKQHRGGSKNN